jgi:hypothetical protein
MDHYINTATRSSYRGAPLLRRLRQTLPLCPPLFRLRGYPGGAKLILGRAPSVPSSRYVAEFMN